jgi:hypothetical protein
MRRHKERRLPSLYIDEINLERLLFSREDAGKQDRA